MRAGVVVLAVLLVLGLGAVGPVSAQPTAADDTTQVGNIEFTITDEHIVVEDLEFTGSGVPDVTIEDRTYTIDDTTLDIDGLRFTLDGKTYEVFDVTIYIDNVTITVSEATFGDG